MERARSSNTCCKCLVDLISKPTPSSPYHTVPPTPPTTYSPPNAETIDRAEPNLEPLVSDKPLCKKALISWERVNLNPKAREACFAVEHHYSFYRTTFNLTHRDPQRCIVKHFKVPATTDLGIVFREAELQLSLVHENILQLHYVACIPGPEMNEALLILENVEGKTLRETLRIWKVSGKPKGFDRDKVRIALGIARALSHLHAAEIAHRNLHSENVVVTTTCDAKVMNFGSAKELEKYNTAMANEGPWAAPEILRGDDNYTVEADIYSFGVILSELDTLEKPFAHIICPKKGKGGMQLVMDVGNGNINLDFTDHGPMYELAKRCSHFEADHRPHAYEVVKELEGILRGM